MKMNRKLKQQSYDRFYRDQESKSFYNSSVWKKARQMKLNRNPCCELCQLEGRITPTAIVHHSIPIKKGTKEVDLNFLVSLCHEHHNKVETEMDREKKEKG